MLALVTAVVIFAANQMAPPARYDHPFKGKVVVHRLPDGPATYAICHTTTGCVLGGTFGHGVCPIYINGLYTGWIYDAVIRHEIAHCNGWPGNHPD